ncbi:MarR family winged helix-turn-helix transcriptional regulator [Gordonia bronchialis]|nr:MarR family transcriptional regulator [Gordonia bronchialis]
MPSSRPDSGDSADDAMGLVHDLRRVVVAVELHGGDFAARHGMHATDVRALIALLDRERAGQQATPGWLAAHLGISSASATALVDRMESAGLVERARHDTDRRKITIAVSGDARELGWSFFGPLIDGVLAVTREFSADELDTVRRFLGSVAHAVDRAAPGQES